MAQLPQDPAAQAAAAPQGAPAPQGEAPQEQQGGGGAQKLLLGSHDAMSKLADAMAQSGQVDEEDIQLAQQIVAMIEQLGDSLGSAKGKAARPVPQETGGKPAQPAM